MKQIILSYSSYALKAFLYGLLCASIILLIGAIHCLNDKPELQLWHTAQLDQEYQADCEVTTFEEYLALEERLFKQLDELIYTDDSPDAANSINRYTRGSSSDATRWKPNWNRSFELKADTPKAGTATNGLVEFVITGTDPLSVTATIDSAAASAGGRLFGRLSAIE